MSLRIIIKLVFRGVREYLFIKMGKQNFIEEKTWDVAKWSWGIVYIIYQDYSVHKIERDSVNLA